MKEKTVMLVGAGRVGIRHFAGILSVKDSLNITVVEPTKRTLDEVKKIRVPRRHAVEYATEIPNREHLDIAIVATTSRDRAAATRTLVKKIDSISFLILEKILFEKRTDYTSIEKLLKKHKIKTWVHHPRRLYPFHKLFAQAERGKRFFYHIRSGNKNTLMTNVTHFVDYFAHLAKSRNFKVDVSMLSRHTVPSRRSGYLEVYGTLVFRFPNGSVGMTTSLPQTDLFAGDYISSNTHATFDETTGTAQIARRADSWEWKSVNAPLTPIGDLIGPVISTILDTGKCELPTYKESVEIHLKVLEPIRKHLKLKSYQFS